jgi:Ca-activated chloride channel family protein
VYASVTGPDGRPVRDLAAADFEVLEDGRPQSVETFAAGTVTAAVALAIDRSLSMAGAPLQMARTAGRVFLASLRDDDRAMLIGIGGQVEVLAPLGTDRAPLLAALASLDAWSATALRDAIIRSIELIDGEHGRRAVVLVSDGRDRYSEASEADVLARVRRSNALVYPIALGGTRPALFVEAAALSGGRSFDLKTPRDLVPTLQAIAEDLGAQYLLGYQPVRPWPDGAGEWRGITVKVNRPGVRVRARGGYTTR